MRLIPLAAIAFAAVSGTTSAGTLSQTVHFAGTNADTLFELYATGPGHTEITGLPATYRDADGMELDRATPGARLSAFCFEPEMCGLDARILDVQSAPGVHTIVAAWWNFGWLQATDKTALSVEGRGAPDSTLTLTFRDTLRGAQVELVQVNVPDYTVVIPNPDGTSETGPLSTIVNTHWNTLYWDPMRAIVAQ